jgi:hypothetical protein
MVNNPGTQDGSRLYNFAGMDDIVGNERTRATANAVTLTGATSLGTAVTTNAVGTNWINGFGAPRTGNSSVGFTVLAADLLTGIIVWAANSASTTLTFDTAANLVNGVNQISAGAVIGDVVQCLLVNGGASTFALAVGSGGALDSNQVNTTLTSGTSKLLLFRLTGVKGGSEGYTLYF